MNPDYEWPDLGANFAKRLAAVVDETCERCDELIWQTACPHRTLCEECAQGCGECEVERADARAYFDAKAAD